MSVYIYVCVYTFCICIFRSTYVYMHTYVPTVKVKEIMNLRERASEGHGRRWEEVKEQRI